MLASQPRSGPCRGQLQCAGVCRRPMRKCSRKLSVGIGAKPGQHFRFG
jgi:hypothetical protein